MPARSLPQESCRPRGRRRAATAARSGDCARAAARALSIGRRPVRAGVQLLVPEPEISLQTHARPAADLVAGPGPGAVRTAPVRGGMAQPQGRAGSRSGGSGHQDGRCEGHRTPGRAGDGGPRRTRPVAHRPDPRRARRSRHLGIRVRRHRGPDGRRPGARRRVRPASPADRRGHSSRLAGPVAPRVRQAAPPRRRPSPPERTTGTPAGVGARARGIPGGHRQRAQRAGSPRPVDGPGNADHRGEAPLHPQGVVDRPRPRSPRDPPRLRARLRELLHSGPAARIARRRHPALLPRRRTAARPVRRRPRNPEPFTTVAPSDIDTALDHFAAAVGADPWVRSWPALLTGVTPAFDDGHWFVVDAQGRALPLSGEDPVLWRLLGMSGGRPVTVFGEWNSESLVPVSVFDRGDVYPLGAGTPSAVGSRR